MVVGLGYRWRHIGDRKWLGRHIRRYAQRDALDVAGSTHFRARNGSGSLADRQRIRFICDRFPACRPAINGGGTRCMATQLSNG